MFECHFTPLQGAKYVKRVQVWLMGWGLRRELSGTGGGMACATGCVGFAEGVVPRKRHDGVCSTTLRAHRGRKRRSYDVKRPVQPRSRHLTAGVPTPSANPRLGARGKPLTRNSLTHSYFVKSSAAKSHT